MPYIAMKSSHSLIFFAIGLTALGVGYYLRTIPTKASVDTGLDGDSEVRLVEPKKDIVIREPAGVSSLTGDSQDGQAQGGPSKDSLRNTAKQGLQKTLQNSAGDTGKDSKSNDPVKEKTVETTYVEHNGKQELRGGTLYLYYASHPGVVEESGPFQNGKREGFWESFSESGAVTSAGSYQNGVSEGAWQSWYDDGTLRFQGDFVQGNYEGVATFYKADGSIDDAKSGSYRAGVLEKKPADGSNSDPSGDPEPNGSLPD